jgi:superfamily II DNA/RNA helicase
MLVVKPTRELAQQIQTVVGLGLEGHQWKQSQKSDAV